MTPSEKRQLITRYAEAFSRGDIDAVCRLFTPDAIVYGVLGSGGLTMARPLWEALARSLQIQLHIEDMVVEGDTVAVRFTERGRFAAPLRGVEPTGRTFEVFAMEWFVLRDGLICQRWGARDSAAIYKQIGFPLV